MFCPRQGKLPALSLLLSGALLLGEASSDGEMATEWDLDACLSKETYVAGSSCPPGSAAACWTPSQQRWACWPGDQVPRWFASRAVADAVCQSWPVQAAAKGQARLYSGACTFEPGVEPPLMPELLSWTDAYTEAQSILDKLEREEKYLLLKGVGWTWPEGVEPGHGYWELKKWWYVGNTPAIPRVGIPSLNIQDSGNGFRPYFEEMVGTVTGWPSALSLAATWDIQLVRLMALSIAQEFLQKGANVILGPGVNVHRSAFGGRNFEYISGEDPHLGARLAKNWVDAMQSQGVMAVAKHWVFNNQETFRDSSSSNVDSKTAHELYYPPFKAAVDAGLSAAMCSYNKVNGEYSCQSSDSLQVLKDEFGLRGFMQSDWWATHGTDLKAGLDQDMPGIADYGIGMTGNWSATGEPQTWETWFSPQLLDEQPEQLIDEACLRILAAMSRVRVTSNVCTPPNCEEALRRNVTNAASSALARSIAAESIVLLQNRGGVLPLGAPVSTVAVVGSAGVAKPYDPSGAGQGEGKQWWTGDIYSGGGSGHIAMHEDDVVTPLAGITQAADSLGMRVLEAANNSVSSAEAAAEQADVTIVVGGASSGESHDRTSLHLDDGVDEQIAAVAKVAKKVVVIMQVPGAVVMPWRDEVDAILVAFLPGQRAGDAWGDVLFGRHPPAGRLPITLPETENDTIRIDPDSTEVNYSEGMRTGYRSSMTAAFPFGHGLTYTTFIYGAASSTGCLAKSGQAAVCVTMPVTNAGAVAASTVPQLYLEFASEAGYPSPILRGFQKTSIILPGGTQSVTFTLSPDDLSYWNDGKWKRGNNLIAHIGESSADIRQTIDLDDLDQDFVMSGGQSAIMWPQMIFVVSMVALVPVACAV